MTQPEGIYPTLEEFLADLHESHPGEEVRLWEVIHEPFKPHTKQRSLPVKQNTPGSHLFQIWDQFHGRWRVFSWQARETETPS